MKLKSYYMDNPTQATAQATTQPTQSKPKKKYLTKKKGYTEDADYLLYNTLTDERELADVTNFRYTQDSDQDSYF